MDLGIEGKKAIICASSRGLGKACALALAREGCEVVINGRDEKALQETLAEIQKIGGKVEAVRADISEEAGRRKLLKALPEPDILINNNGGPPPGDFHYFKEEDWIAAVKSNMLTAIFLIKEVIEGMQKRRFGRIVNITSAMVKSPHPLMGLSTSARSGLTAFCKGISGEVSKDNVTINNLLPERFDTDRQKTMAKMLVETQKISMEEAYAQISETVAAKRLGTPEEFADACAFLCSQQAGYISGQNLQLDGGSYQGLL